MRRDEATQDGPEMSAAVAACTHEGALRTFPHCTLPLDCRLALDLPPLTEKEAGSPGADGSGYALGPTPL